MEDKNYIKLAQGYHFLKSCNNLNRYENIASFKAVVDSDFNINYKLPSNCFISHNKPQYSGNTILHFAIVFYNEFNSDCFDYLLEHGNDIIQNDNGLTPLLLALEEQKCVDPILFFYHRQKNFTNFYSKNGLSHFHAACSTNYVEIIKCYLSKGVSVNEHVNNGSPSFAGYTPLHFAMQNCQAQTVKLLLQNGANFNSKDANGMTPLQLLIKNVVQKNDLELNTEMHKFLLNAVSNNLFKLPDNVGLTYTHLSCIFKSLEHKFKCFKQNKNIDSPLNLDSPVCPGYTPLHFAVQFNFSIVMLLLESGADLLVKDINGTTPFDLCLKKYNLDGIIQIWLKEKKHQLSKLTFLNNVTVLDVLQAMKKESEFDYFLLRFNNINSILPLDSPVWPGCSILHLAVRLNNPIFTTLAYQANLNMLDKDNMSPLHVAFRMMKNEAVSKILCYSNVNLANVVDPDNLSHLHIACAVNNVKAIEHLLKNGANVNLPTLRVFEWNLPLKGNLVINTGSTPLHIAVHISCIMSCDIVSILMPYGANPNLIDANGLTPYHIVLKHQSGTIFNQMLKFDHEKGYEKIGLTRLHIACIIRDFSMAETELKSGADVNKCINHSSPVCPGDTALHILCNQEAFQSKKNFFKLLITHGADPYLPNANNIIPVHLRHGQLYQITNLPLRNDFYLKNPINNEGFSTFHLYCSTNNFAVIKNFIDSGVNVNTPVDYFADLDAGYTPFHYAIRSRNLKFIELLLRYRADPNIKAINGLTPLLLAVYFNNISQVQVALRYPEVDIQATNALGETAIGIILRSVRINNNMLNLFLDRGVSLKCSKFIAKIPGRAKLINLAIWKLSLENFKRLMESVQYTNSNIHDLAFIDDQGQNMIHHITSLKFLGNLSSNFIEAVKIFIDSGCELDHQNKKGKTPLHLAASLGHTEIAKVLMRFGADINIRDDDGKTPFAYVTDQFNVLKLAFNDYVRNLEKVGLHVDESNKLNLDSGDINDASNTIIAEKEKLDLELKRIISPSFSATYFFSKKFINDYQNISATQRQTLYRFFSNDLDQKFPKLSPMINLQFNKARSKFRKNRLLVSAANALSILTGQYSQEIRQEIVSYLNIYCLVNLICAVNKNFKSSVLRLDNY